MKPLPGELAALPPGARRRWRAAFRRWRPPRMIPGLIALLDAAWQRAEGHRRSA